MSTLTETYPIEEIRAAFPMLDAVVNNHPLIYLDTAATSLKPQSVIRSIDEYYSQKYGTVHRAVYSLASHATKAYHDVRTQIQRFLNAPSSEEIIFTKGTTNALNMIARCFGEAFIEKGDEIIISEMEHHANMVPWQVLCEKKGAILKYIPVNRKAELDLEVFASYLTDKTKLVSIAHVANSTGTLNPIEKIIEAAHRKNVKVLIDGAQGAGHLKVDVQALDCDFYVFSAHKAYGPTGVGVLYGKRELLDQMPPYEFGGDMIEMVTLESSTYQKLPLKFETGTPPIAEVIGLGKAIEFIEKIGIDQITSWEHSLLLYATEKMLEIEGLHIFGTSAQKGAIISFTIEGIHPLDMGSFLDLKGIALRTGHHCAQPLLRKWDLQATARVSFGLYNTHHEIDIFIDALKQMVVFFK